MKNVKCYTCAYYDVFYIKGTYQFMETGCGRCNFKKETVKRNCVCENWKERKPQKEGLHEYTIEALNRACESISEIKQILNEKFS